MKVLFVASEAKPFAASGGLGDVAGSLPKMINKKGEDVRVIMPLYKEIPAEFKNEMEKLGEFKVELNWRNQKAEIFKLERDGVIYYFVGNDYYFDRKDLYKHYDDAERFIFFSKAVLDFIPKFEFWPDILHCNDWHTAIIPYLLNKQYRVHYQDLKTILTIHNIKFQGIYGVNTVYDILGLHPEEITGDIEFRGNVNIMKAGIYNADWVNTVSPTYAKELEYDYFGEGLQEVIKENNHKMSGILNGIDYDVYNPQYDENIYENYTRSLKKKKNNKMMLLKELGLEENDEKPLIGVISRLDELKGVDLILHVMYEIMNLDVNLVVLGTGEKNYEDSFRQIASVFPNNARVIIDFNSEMASKIYAGSDIILMPSRIEPCGLVQMIALKYGTIPLVRKIGGLNDSITKFEPASKEGNGFVFRTYNAHEMLHELKRGVKIYKKNKEAWDQLVKNAFKSKFSWDKSAEEYIELYNKL
jgi:starch synthase